MYRICKIKRSLSITTWLWTVCAVLVWQIIRNVNNNICGLNIFSTTRTNERFRLYSSVRDCINTFRDVQLSFAFRNVQCETYVFTVIVNTLTSYYWMFSCQRFNKDLMGLFHWWWEGPDIFLHPCFLWDIIAHSWSNVDSGLSTHGMAWIASIVWCTCNYLPMR